jgi:hypothetical protein
MSAGLKNVCRTWPLPGASRMMAASAASTTTVLAVDSAAPRRLRSLAPASAPKPHLTHPPQQSCFSRPSD